MAKGRVYKYGDLEITVGNTKLGKDTMILNMGPATDCPSLKNGMCKLGDCCYALKAERMYPGCKPYRERQAHYWLTHCNYEIMDDIRELLVTKRVRIDGKLQPLYKSIKWLRYNEAGDFHSQECIEKLNYIAVNIWMFAGIKTYGYSARKDLDFSNVEFHVKSSGHHNGNNGRTIARTREQIQQGRGADGNYVESGVSYQLCPRDCRDCNLCKEFNRMNVVFPMH